MGLDADELGIVLAVALPLLALVSRRARVLLRHARGRVALALGRPQERYGRWFLAEYGVLRNIYLNQVETLDLADSYISLSVQVEGEASAAQVPATTLLAEFGPRRIVIVGDPGTGKSTLLKAYGSGLLRRTAGNSELNLFGRTNELPFLITLQRGRVVVLLDGLDEISPPAYEAVRSAIHAFVTADEHAELPTSMARVVITCRRQTYRQIEDDWMAWFSSTSYAIAALRDADIERFVNRRAAQFPAERPAAAFLADVRASGTVDLHRVPLILTISVGLYTQLTAYEIPHSVGAFYDEMVRELLRRHDFRAENQLRMNRYRAEDKHRFLRELAVHLARTRWSPFADFTYGEILEFCSARRGTVPRLRDDRDFVDEIIDRSGLLIRTTDAGHFAFAHRAFHEHLAAAQLARDPQLGCTFLLEHAQNPEWRQVILLFCGENHPYVAPFLQALADESVELACHCLATAEVSTDVAASLIDQARQLSLLPAIMETVKSPVTDTRSLAFEALRSELLWIAQRASPAERRRIFSGLFGGHLPVAGKVLLAMSDHATPEMANAIAELTATLPDDEPTLVAPLWHCLAIPDLHRRRTTAQQIVERLLLLAMNRECAETLERLPALRPAWVADADRTAAYPLKRGLPASSNLVSLLGMGHALRVFDLLPRKNLYLTALAEPGRPLAMIETSPFWLKLSPHRVVQVLSWSAFIAALVGNLAVARLAYRGGVDLRQALLPLLVSLAVFTVVVVATSMWATRRFVDHLYAAPFTRWVYLLPTTESAFSPSQVERSGSSWQRGHATSRRDTWWPG
ncbi:hypothetical protein SAMN05421812_105391 [Asanoa hainanensis]|uniref:NACHT domain-containing protein n=1 Tax=Asanoa hainanensis TaxID=560556 RepID=A0A239MEE5_9ACTN|nr:hypothetical protein [Asanoa hainanensis]SNT41065.1 hypothetical protein SAMN05421812_105391 [Asanoa hainanensis]